MISAELILKKPYIQAVPFHFFHCFSLLFHCFQEIVKKIPGPKEKSTTCNRCMLHQKCPEQVFTLVHLIGKPGDWRNKYPRNILKSKEI